MNVNLNGWTYHGRDVPCYDREGKRFEGYVFHRQEKINGKVLVDYCIISMHSVEKHYQDDPLKYVFDTLEEHNIQFEQYKLAELERGSQPPTV